MKEGCQTSRILQPGIRLLALINYKHVFPFKGKEEWLQKHSYRGRSWRGRPRGGTSVLSAGLEAEAGLVSGGSEDGMHHRELVSGPESVWKFSC